MRFFVQICCLSYVIEIKSELRLLGQQIMTMAITSCSFDSSCI